MITDIIRMVISTRKKKNVRDSNLIEMTITHKSIRYGATHTHTHTHLM